jgi:hypothetical protein
MHLSAVGSQINGGFVMAWVGIVEVSNYHRPREPGPGRTPHLKDKCGVTGLFLCAPRQYTWLGKAKLTHWNRATLRRIASRYRPGDGRTNGTKTPGGVACQLRQRGEQHDPAAHARIIAGNFSARGDEAQLQSQSRTANNVIACIRAQTAGVQGGRPYACRSRSRRPR